MLAVRQRVPNDPLVLSRMLDRIRGVSRGDLAVRWLGGMCAVIPLLALVFVLSTLIIEALPAIKVNGLHFFTSTEWNQGNLYGNSEVSHGVPHPIGVYYGALPMIVGTLAS